jgi:hypothetical protein
VIKKLTLKHILLGLGILFILTQFIRPAKTNGASGSAHGPDDITHVVNVPADVQQILSTSCNDCHSNHTNYPWYTNIQPVGLWLDHHVDEGVSEINFSTFSTYKRKRQLHKLDEIAEMIEEHEMPLSSYTLMHTNAKLTDAQEQVLINWAKAAKRALQDTSATTAIY